VIRQRSRCCPALFLAADVDNKNSNSGRTDHALSPQAKTIAIACAIVGVVVFSFLFVKSRLENYNRNHSHNTSVTRERARRQSIDLVMRIVLATARNIDTVVDRNQLGTRECSICVEDRLLHSGFPKRLITDSCNNECMESPPCLECLSNAIKAALDLGNFGRILCPGCSAQLTFKDVMEFGRKQDFVR
jgi:hypothetical protein